VLTIIKLVHTLVWAVFAGAIMALPWFIVKRRWKWTAALIGLVMVECAVLAMNGMRCPLTDLAARYTADRTDNFDIYLPLWLARHNKVLFGTMFGVELIWAGSRALLSRKRSAPSAHSASLFH
jgi:hypothetical protein